MSDVSNYKTTQSKKISCRMRLFAGFVMLLCLVIVDLQSPSVAQDVGAAQSVHDQATREYLENQAWWWMARQRAYPMAVEDVLALDSIDKAHRSVGAHLREKRIHSSQNQLPTLPAGVWESIGPSHYDSDAYFFAPENSARIVSSAIDPGDPEHWLIGSQNGGLWQTRDAGKSWAPRTDDLAPLGMSAIAFAPGDPAIVYTVTRAGLLKSFDGGDTWSILNTSPPFDGESARILAVSPENSDVVLAAIDEWFTFFNNHKRGIYKSTDGGLSWTRKLELSATDLVVDPEDFSRQYAAIGQMGDNLPGFGLHRSTDTGETWHHISGPWDGSNRRIGLAIASSNPNVLYALVEDSGAYNAVLGLWKTMNAWDPHPVWVQLPVVENFSHGRPLSVDPADADVLLHGAIALSRFDGVEWTDVADLRATTEGRPGGMHGDFYSLSWADTRLIATNDGGIFSSPTGTPPWTSHNSDLRINEFYWGLGLQPGNEDFALMGAQDAGTLIFTGQPIWSQLAATGDGMANAVSYTTPHTDWLVSGTFMSISRTLDGGLTFDNNINTGIDLTGTSFFTEFLRCPNGNRIIAGTDNLWLSDDAFTAPIPGWASNGPEMGSSIEALAFVHYDEECQRYAFGTGDSALRATSDAGASWFDIDPLNNVPGRAITDLAFDPNDAETLYVTLSGFGGGHLFRGEGIFSGNPQWTDIGPLIDIPHNAVAIDPNSSATIYVGTDLGLWVTFNEGQNWTHIHYSELPHVIVTDIEFHPESKNVTVATYGRGAYQLTFPNTTIVPALISQTQASAEAAIADSKLVVGTVTILPDAAADGLVIALTPVAGSEVVEGTSVDLTISSGPEPIDPPVTVPTSPAPLFPLGNDIGLESDFFWPVVPDAHYYVIEVQHEGLIRAYEPMIPVDSACSSELCIFYKKDAVMMGDNRWRLRAGNNQGVSDWSPWTDFVVSQPAGAGAPGPLDGKDPFDMFPLMPVPDSPGGSGHALGVKFQWPHVPGVINYAIEIQHDGLIRGWVPEISAALACVEGDCEFAMTDAALPGSNRWRLSARNEIGQTQWSDWLMFTVSEPETSAEKVPAVPVPDSPHGAGVEVGPDYTWHGVAGATHYAIEIQHGSEIRGYDSMITVSGACEANNCRYAKPDAALTGGNRWRLGAYNNNGFSGWSQWQTFIVQ